MFIQISFSRDMGEGITVDDMGNARDASGNIVGSVLTPEEEERRLEEQLRVR